MKNNVLCLILILILIMLTGCSTNHPDVYIETNSVVTSKNITTGSMFVDTEKTPLNTTSSNIQITSIIAESIETSTEILPVTTQVNVIDTSLSTEQQFQYTETVESEQSVPTIVEDKYFIVSLTPQKIYWNEIKEFNIEIDENFDILVPISLYEIVKESDQLVIYFNELSKFSFNEEDQYNVKATINGRGNGIWYMDEFCQIIDGKLCFYESNENISKYFYDFSQLYGTKAINEANISDIKFIDGMTIYDIDYYFEQARKQANTITQEMLENPDTLFELPVYYIYTSKGVRFRAQINKIY